MESCGKLPRSDPPWKEQTGPLQIVENGRVTSALATIRACSACAGDYEDPDRTAWTPDNPDAGEEDEPPATREEKFPAGE